MHHRDYQVFEIEGKLHPSGFIDILSRHPHANSPQRISFLPNTFPIGSIQLAYHAPGTPAPIGPKGSLYQCLWTDETQNVEYLGEVGGGNVIQTPPIPVFRKTGPDKITIVSKIHTWNDDGTPNTIPLDELECESYILSKNISWGHHSLVYRIGLVERNPDPYPDLAYNYIWDVAGNGPPLVDFWYGVVTGDKVTGYQYYS